MAKFEVLVVALALFAIAYARRRKDEPQEDDSQEDGIGGVPGRDDWAEMTQTFTDLPRIFNRTAPCPAKHFYLDCNQCHCLKDGSSLAACTRMGCPKIPQIVNWGEKGVVCPAGKQFYWKCNNCGCDDTGTGAVCTRKACLK